MHVCSVQLTNLSGFGFGFFQSLYELYIIKHVSCGGGQLSQQRVLKVFQQTFVLTSLLNKPFSLLLLVLLLKSHNNTQQLVFQAL